uniref:Uncharacterized protein n=1 Tax=Anopheles dirus TaxID=7168 RepID=A0A182NWX7_9DIPT
MFCGRRRRCLTTTITSALVSVFVCVLRRV